MLKFRNFIQKIIFFISTAFSLCSCTPNGNSKNQEFEKLLLEKKELEDKINKIRDETIKSREEEINTKNLLIERQEREMKEKDKTIKQLNTEIKTNSSIIDQLEEDIEKKDDSIKKLETKLVESEKERAKETFAVYNLKKNIKELEKKLDERGAPAKPAEIAVVKEILDSFVSDLSEHFPDKSFFDNYIKPNIENLKKELDGESSQNIELVNKVLPLFLKGFLKGLNLSSPPT